MIELQACIESEYQQVLEDEVRYNNSSGNTGGAHNFHILFASVLNNVSKIEKVGNIFESVERDSSKLHDQIVSCQEVSSKLSKQIRRLDNMFTRANNTLQYVENILNLKESKSELLLAINENNLHQAVGILNRVHSIESLTVEPTDDYIAIQTAEVEVRTLVKKEFSTAIESSNIELVMSLCPLLSTLGLEEEARDSFLSFMSKAVFVNITADSIPQDDNDSNADIATAYASSLSSIFNSCYLIMQQYLPVIIEGMETTYGDVHFIRQLYNKCAREATVVLKRYMKYRQVRETIQTIKLSTTATSSSAVPPSSSIRPVSSSEMHTILDEMTVLIQYACTYNKYILQICIGAENRKRKHTSVPITVFDKPTEFNQLIDEFIQRYYVEGEKWLISTALSHVFTKQMSSDQSINSSLDESFFILQRCLQRSIASQNIDATIAVLHSMCMLFTGPMLKEAQEIVDTAVDKISSIIQTNINGFYRSIDANYNPEPEPEVEQSNAMLLHKSLQNLYVTSTTASSLNETNEEKLILATESFQLISTCQRYIERLGRDAIDLSMQLVASEESDKLQVCRDDFTNAKNAFHNVSYCYHFISISYILVCNIL
jgi:COG4 transport protein